MAGFAPCFPVRDLRAALAAATDVLVPVQPEDYGAQGLADVFQSVNSVQTD